MQNPFPGMNPYLDRDWQDLHQRFITYASDELAPRLPRELRVRVQQRVFVESPLGAVRNIYPDLHVVEQIPRSNPAAATTSGATIAEPLVVRVPDDPVTEGYIEIVEPGSGYRVVTVIELLSVSNRQPGPGQELYLRKQKECLDARVNLVEIDLLRQGEWVVAVPQQMVPPSLRRPYRICVRRGARPLEAEFYHVPMRERLPVIRVPLRAHESDALLDIQAPLDQSFRSGIYDGLDYTHDPDPPLEANDATWADELLRSRGLR